MNSKLLFVALSAMVFFLSVFGGEENKPKETRQPQIDFIRDRWGTEDGLPQSSVTAVVQTRDGYLWLGTFGGLARFDGIKFTVFNTGDTKALKSSRILALYEDRSGALWIGAEGGGLTRYADGQFTNYTAKDGLPSYNVSAIYEDTRGVLWIGTERGLVSFKNGTFTTRAGRDELSATPVFCILEDREGALWVGTANGLGRFKDGHFKIFTIADGLPHNGVLSLCATADGSLWAATGNGLARFYDGKVTTYLVKIDKLNSAVTSLFEDRADVLWIGTRTGGLFRMLGGTPARYDDTDALPNSDISVIVGDREGNIWVGTNTGGLNRLKTARLVNYGAKQGLAINNIVPITEDADGSVWMGLTCGGLVKLRDGEFTAYTEKDGLPNNCVWSLLADADGSLWIGSWNGGLTEYKNGRFFTYNDKNSRLSNNVVLALYKTRDGTLWVGTNGGLNSFRDGRFDVYRREDGLVSDDVRFITEDRAGALWIGTTGGVSRFENGRFTNYTTEDGLSDNFVRAVYEDADGTVWIGTYGGGLNRFKDGKFVRFNRENGLFDDVVSRILEDADGNLWMSGNRGIFRVGRRELNDFADGLTGSVTSVSYGESDGMASRETNGGGQPAGWKTRDGRLWFPTIKGAVLIDPALSKINQLPPPVVIEQALANRKRVEHPSGIEIEPGNSDLEIEYTGLSFVAPEKVRFKYKLEGYDRDWTDAGARRTAYYTNVPPGRFQFRVIAANNDGVWNTDGATLEVFVVPPFYRTWWFYALSASAFFVILFGAYRYRLRKIEEKHREREAFSRRLLDSQEQERKRIAAEMHDGLGQSLAIIKNRARSGLKDEENPENMANQLDGISEAASQALEEVKEIAFNLRPYLLDKLGLTKTVESMLGKVFAASEVGLKTEIDDIDGVFSKDSEILFYRIVQECVNNIIKHADATAAEIIVKRSDGNLFLQIRDDGKGFDSAAQEVSASESFGLIGIAERARFLGGRHSIASEIGKGTTITIEIDLRDER